MTRPAHRDSLGPRQIGSRPWGYFKEFREFIARGNVVDLAVGVIIGGAFNGVIKSLVEQVIMPPIGLLTSGVDFAKLEFVLKPADLATKHAAVVIQYGAFINTVIQFLIIAAAVFADGQGGQHPAPQ